MKRLKQKTLAYILALPLVYGTASLPQSAWAGAEREPEAAGMIIDGLVVRPISLVATVVGAVAFVITLPFSALGGNVDEEGEAQEARRGIWAGEFVRPWEWRRGKRLGMGD